MHANQKLVWFDFFNPLISNQIGLIKIHWQENLIVSIALNFQLIIKIQPK